jgi:hypothetical protein
MGRYCSFRVAGLTSCLFAATANATPPLEPLSVNLSAGLSVPVSDAGDRFHEGAAFRIGAAWKFTDRFSAGAEIFHSFYGIRSSALSARDLTGDHQMRYGELVAAVRFMRDDPWDVYVIGGPGR